MIDSSSFFWLGLVGAVFVGLAMTLLRARVRATGVQQQPRSRKLAQVKPRLWDVHIDLEAGKDGKERKGWDMLPLALQVLVEERTASATPASVPVAPGRYAFFRRAPLPEPPPYPQQTDAQISTLVLMPSLQKPPPSDSTGTLQHEYAVGTTWVRGPALEPSNPATTT